MAANDPAQDKLAFGLYSGGRIEIDTALCAGCTTHACVRNCLSTTLEPVLVIREGRPALSRPDIRPESGWCIECLACELDCAAHGRGAVTIRFADDLKEARRVHPR